MNALSRLARVAAAALLVLVMVPSAPLTASAATLPDPTPVYRFFNTGGGSHFFTTNEAEKDAVIAGAPGFRYEGIAFYSYPTPGDGTSPVYRFYNFRVGVHFYTNNEQEYRSVLANSSTTYRYEGIAYHSFATPVTNSIPVHRFYNFRQGVHFYTANQAEATFLNDNRASTYRYEGIAYYLPSQLTFSGRGNSVTDSFVLPGALSVARTTYSGTSGDFTAELRTAETDTYIDLVASENASDFTVSKPLGPDEGEYVLDVTSQGTWTITIEQPKVSSGGVTSFSGTDDGSTRLFTLPAGTRSFSYIYRGPSNFIAQLYDANGRYVDLIINKVGNGRGTIELSPGAGVYVIGVVASGEWSIDLE